jgi:hypothetical protein
MSDNNSMKRDLDEQIDNLKGLIGKIDATNDPMDTVRATISAEFVVRQVREYCLMQLSTGGADVGCTAA